MSKFKLNIPSDQIEQQNNNDEFIEELGLQENGEDNRWTDEDKKTVGNAVVFSTDWTTETIINQIKKGNIELNPSFQRRDAWTSPEKSRFIESLIIGLPIPQIVLANNSTSPGKYIVLDGKQRLLSLFQFAGGIASNKELVLSKLKIRDDLNGLRYKDLVSHPSWSGEVSSFENQPIRTVVIKNFPHESFLYEVFLRLNTGSKPLSPQELRQALHPGSFTMFIDDYAANSSALMDILNKRTPDFRMRDVELLLRAISYHFFLENYNGDLKGFLDNVCMTFNSCWDNAEFEVNAFCKKFEDAHWFVREIFKENSYRKYTNGKFTNRFNRAILDSMIYHFIDKDVRNSLVGKEDDIKAAFINLCETNPEYINSIESTTKTPEATNYRISIWGEELRKLGAPIK
ncbi:hypothetical protein SMETH2_14950 [Serratia marcescens]|uniref:DUF262 domain-containing protein n=1 Tax=Serratia ureilytica TaxID=300181 RepID=UPI00313C99CD|nr:hypothetical protein SMETH2_14950 [Serratia marcescens]